MPTAQKPKTASKAARVEFVEPMYAELVQQLPQGNSWLYEVKFDGYRCLAGRDSRDVTLWSRRGNDFTAQFPNIGQGCESLPVGTVLDGEIVAIDESGRISFNLLQHHRSQAQALLFYVFDVLVYRGINLVNEPLTTRREVLGKLLKPLRQKATAISLSETIDASPAELISVVKEFGFEGVIVKRKDSYYESGKRSGAWLRYKVNKGQEFVIGGYRPGNPIDAVIVGYYQGDQLLYAAKLRNGFLPGYGAKYGRGWKDWRSLIARSPICQRENALNGR
jgi:ATP-dependent DNA ligase